VDDCKGERGEVSQAEKRRCARASWRRRRVCARNIGGGGVHMSAEVALSPPLRPSYPHLHARPDDISASEEV